MIQILLILFGLFILIKGNLKVSDTKGITRPQSIYWGLIVIVYGVASSFLPEKLIYFVIFYGSLVLISVFFLVTGKTIASGGTAIKSANTKRNLIILLVFIAFVGGIFVQQWWPEQKEKTPGQKETRKPEITILSPNGGEKLQAGRSHYIKWTATGARGNVSIELKNKNGQLIYYVAEQGGYPAFAPNTGSYLLSIPSTEQVGDYKARVMLCPSGSSAVECGLADDIYDESDSYFSIVAASIIIMEGDWRIYRNEEAGFEFKYPIRLDFDHIDILSDNEVFPTTLTVGERNSNFVCGEPKESEIPGEITREIMFNDSKYCVSSYTEAGAGSYFTTYTFIVDKNERQLTLKFAIKTVNCQNYADSNTGKKCEEEKKNFDPLVLADRILSTFRFPE